MIQMKITRLLIGLMAAMTVGLLLAGPASAVVSRTIIHSFGKDGTEGTNFNGGKIAFDQASKRVYMTYQSPNGIFGFDASTPGTYTPLPAFSPKPTANPNEQSGLSLDGSGNIYLSTTNTNRVYKLDSGGNFLAPFGGELGLSPASNPGPPDGSPTYICGSVADAAGNVWVSNYETRKILEYDSSGTFLKSIDASPLTEGGVPCSLGYDLSSGALYVQIFGNTLWKLSPPNYETATAVKIDNNSQFGIYGFGVDSTSHHVFVSHYDTITEYEPNGTKVGEFGKFAGESYRSMAINGATNEVYVVDNEKVRVFGNPVVIPNVTATGSSNIDRTTVDVQGTVDPDGGGDVTECKVEWVKEAPFGGFNSFEGSTNCSNSLPITSAGPIEAHITGLTAQKNYQFRFKVGNANGPNRTPTKEFRTKDAITNIQVQDATEVGLESATLHGSFEREGFPTKYYFQYTGKSDPFGNPEWNNIEVSAAPPGPLASSDTLTFELPSGLAHGRTYHYRLFGTNEFGTTLSNEKTFYTSGEPSLYDEKLFVTDVNTDQATIHLSANPNGQPTSYHVEWGTEGPCDANPCEIGPTINFGAGVLDGKNAYLLQNLEPGTVYSYRIVMSNIKGTVKTASHTFTTFDHTKLPPPCPNALARQQTGAALLLDCRAFELVSAANTGGYDVESSLAPGQTPFGGFPLASSPSRVLYGIHNGAIPGIAGSPTNKGIDPYIATRGDGGWSTRYVGIPADGTPSVAPFSSHLLEADPMLDSFAFGGSNDLCSPCFGDGSSGIPIRLANGSLVQGMAGETDPKAKPDGLVKKVYSDTGNHFVFGSASPYTLDGNTGDVSIYDRNLTTGVTQVVSKSPAGTNLTCLLGAGTCHSPGHPNGIAELAMSGDGSRIVVGQLVSEDGAGNDYYHLYMHIGNNSHTVDLTPSTLLGAHFAGMTSDGSAVYFTTRDALTTPTNQDTDGSIDLFRASVDGAGAMTLSRVSTGIAPSGSQGSGNYNGCDPTGDSASPDNWNAVPGGPTDCSVVAVGGGGGVASGDGTVYFVSPETLDGSGDANSPNLFAVPPGGSPEFVATLASNANMPFKPEQHLLEYETSGFAIPTGAAFDHATGGYYVMDNAWRYPNFQEDEAHAFVQKFKANGELDQSFGVGGKIDGSTTPGGLFRQLGKWESNNGWATPDSLAVDNTCKEKNLTGVACSTFDPSNGMLYVPDLGNNVVDKFDSHGNYISQMDIKPILGATNLQVVGVDVDTATGNVLVVTLGGSEFGSGILVFDNTVNNQYTGTKIAQNEIRGSADIALDSAGNLYVTTGSVYEGRPSFYTKYAAPGYASHENITNGGVSGIAYDPISDHLYLDKGDSIEEVTTAGTQVGPLFGTETPLHESFGLDAYDNRIIVSNKGPTHTEGKFEMYGPVGIPPDKRYDDALVIDSVSDGDMRHTKDFQITADGDTAAFGSAVLITGYEPEGHEELYRHDQPDDEIVCVSCPATNAAATGDASLAENGLNLIDDGRVIFTATEPLVLRDTNGKADVYEWNDGVVQPISPGSDQFGSKLLTVTADGIDAYFFTHSSLAPEDRNGNQAKIYDARENGGFFVVPPQPPCVASDECHGPGSQATPTPNIGSYGGSPTEVSGKGNKCPKGKVKKKGRCVPRHKKKHHKRHATGKRG